MTSVYGNGVTVFAPVGSSEDKMSTVLTRPEIDKLIDTIPACPIVWIENDNQRREAFNDILKTGSHREMIQLLKALYLNREEKLQSGRKFLAADEKVMKEVERRIYEEIAFVMDIKPAEVSCMIREKLAGHCEVQ